MKKSGLSAALLVLFCLATDLFAQVQPIRLIPFIPSGLTSPVFMTTARDGTNRIFIVQQGGLIRVLQPGSTTPTTFLNITTRVLSGGERGLLGLAFHPQYSTNRRFFVYYTRQPDGAIQIAEYRTSTGDPNVADPAETILLTIPRSRANHNGGNVAFGPDGHLYIGPGDSGGGNDPDNVAQNINSLLGKMLRIDVNNIPAGEPYGIPADNPFVNLDGRDEIFAHGLRNPYRFSFDRGGTNQLWLGDVGQNALEEVNVITRGGNFGWRIYEGTLCTNLDGCAFPTNYVAPVLTYSLSGPRCAVTGGYVYRGPLGTFPQGSYIYADYCTGEILLWDGSQQQLLLDSPRAIAGFGEDEAGEIYVVGLGGTIDRISLASVSISGRVTTPAGQGLRNAVVNLTNSAGDRRTATTSSFGIYQFENVDTAQTYTMTVTSKRYRFAPRIEEINNAVSTLDFAGLE